MFICLLSAQIHLVHLIMTAKLVRNSNLALFLTSITMTNLLDQETTPNRKFEDYDKLLNYTAYMIRLQQTLVSINMDLQCDHES